MQCPQCQHENPDGSRFCNTCGGKLEMICPACAHVNPPRSRFCNDCGHNLAAAPSSTQPETRPLPAAERSPIASSIPEAERRQLTVLFWLFRTVIFPSKYKGFQSDYHEIYYFSMSYCPYLSKEPE